MNAKDLLKDSGVIEVSGGVLPDTEITGIASDSRNVKNGTLFFAVKGSMQDGHNYIGAAIKNGAALVVLEDRSFMSSAKDGVVFALVKSSKDSLVSVAGIFFGHPYENISSIGITGTNGKTTTSYLLRSIFNTAGKKCALIGTIGYMVKDTNIASVNTTPGIIELHELARDMVRAGNKYVAMEVSSHALHQDRVAGIVFSSAIFTNLTQDHLDYHKGMEEYFTAKQKLFTEHVSKTSGLIINNDDSFGMRLYNNLKGKKLGYGFNGLDVCVREYEIGKSGSRVMIKTPQGEFDIVTKLVGKHNIYNIMAAVACGISEGIDIDSIRTGVESVAMVPGRLERVDASKGFSVFIDYAHTDDALKNVLESLRSIIHNGRIITVFGCGGDRDKGKRPKMGAVAAALSDYCIITSDNPRSEDPKEIISQVISGIVTDNFESDVDRKSAICRAIKMAEKDDFILVAGKGHETYQITGEDIIHFDDKAVVSECIACLK